MTPGDWAIAAGLVLFALGSIAMYAMAKVGGDADDRPINGDEE